MNVLIIGGSTDIGNSLAKYLNSLGNTVIIGYNKHYKEVEYAKYIKCDVTNEEEIEDTFKTIKKEYGNIDLLINMAAISIDNDINDITKNDYLKVLEVNLVGSFLTSKIYNKYNKGTIINISSTDGIDTYNEYNLCYATSKSALITMTKSLSLSTNNKIICICPNWIDSETTRSIDSNYLKNELKRINQDRLITLDEFNKSIDKILKDNSESGSIFRIDIKGSELWIEKV